MEYRNLGASGLQVPVLSFGTGTFGGQGPLFSAWGRSGADEARRLVDICLEAGVNLFDSADVYSNGASEEILGAAIKGRRDKVLISTKMSLPMGDGPLDAGSSRYRLLASVESALRRLGTDHDRHGWPRHVAHQVYYSLLGRDYEWELMPLARDQGVGALVWSPLGWGRLTGKIRRDQPLPQESRLHATAQFGPPVDDERLYAIVDVLDTIAAETGRTVPQVAIAWLLSRPTVSSVIIGARDEAQLRDNLGAVGWSLSVDQLKHLDEASAVMPPYPYYPYRIQEGFARLNPPPV